MVDVCLLITNAADRGLQMIHSPLIRTQNFGSFFLKYTVKKNVKHIKVFRLEFGFEIILCITCPLLFKFQLDDQPANC